MSTLPLILSGVAGFAAGGLTIRSIYRPTVAKLRDNLSDADKTIANCRDRLGSEAQEILDLEQERSELKALVDTHENTIATQSRALNVFESKAARRSEAASRGNRTRAEKRRLAPSAAPAPKTAKRKAR